MVMAVAYERAIGLIQSVFDTLSGLGTEEAAPVSLTPAVPIKRSVTDIAQSGGLGADYPMIAPNYALMRAGLGEEERSWAEAKSRGTGACANPCAEAPAKESSGGLMG